MLLGEAHKFGTKCTQRQTSRLHVCTHCVVLNVNRKKLCVSGITYFSCNGKNMFICIVIVLYSGVVVDNTTSELSCKQMVYSTLNEVIELQEA